MDAPSPLLAAARYCLFETEIGACGLAWSARGLTRLQLPEADADATDRRLRSCADVSAGAPPAPVEQVIAGLRRYFAGAQVEFTSVALDLAGADAFQRAVYDATRSLCWGTTTTYGELARNIGSPHAARAVGQALGRNPVPIIVPCHRVLASGQRLGGFSAFGGGATKRRLLALEGIHLDEEPPRLPGL
jgi:methylated-DNA-[protein]-cysteine S-methyltransferase